MALRALFLAAALSLAIGAFGATGNITTFAGGGAGAGVIAALTPLSGPHDGAFDAAGNYYFTETSGQRIRRVTPAGIISTVAGADLQGEATLVRQPQRVAVDGAGNVYFSDWGDHRVRKVDTAGNITVVAGAGGPGFAGDGGPATAALLNQPDGIAVDGAGNVYISDSLNFRVRKVVASSGIITTIAGIGAQPCNTAGSTYPPTLMPDGNGGPASAAYVHPGALMLDGAGGYFIADTCGTIRHVDGSGTITRVAGGGGPNGPGLTPVDALSVYLPVEVSLSRDGAGNLYVGSFYFVAKVTPAGMITRFAGTGSFGDSGDGGPATSAQLAFAYGVTANPAGEVLITAGDFNRIRKVDLSGTISHFAGLPSNTTTSSDTGAGDGGAATAALLPTPAGLAKDAAGNVYIADFERVRRVDPSGVITTFVGGGTSTADGIPANTALGVGIKGVAVDASGNLYYSQIRPPIPGPADCIRKVDTSGVVRTFAGTCGLSGFSGDGGLATAARLNMPTALAFDAGGNLYFLDAGNGRIRRIDTSGTITTVAGSGIANAFGDGGLATSAGFSATSIALDSAGNLFITDVSGSSIRKVDTAGIITTIAGNGNPGFSGDGGPATNAMLQMPSGVLVDADGNVYIADTWNNRIRMIGVDGNINTVAGTGASTGTIVEGIAALSAVIPAPSSLAFGPGGALLYSEPSSHRVRRIELTDSTPDPFSFTAQNGVAVSTPVQSGAVTPTGFAGTTSIGVVGGEYSVGCNGTFVSTPGTMGAGQSVCVRHTSSARNNVTVTTALSIGGRVGTFQSTTVVAPGSAALSAPSIDFGAQSMMTTSPARTITITNSGSTTVTVNQLLTGADFAATTDCDTLAPGATCTVAVTFTPRTQGTIDQTLTLQNSFGPQVVPLSGFGERSLTTHYYRAILRRDPDVAGKAFWESEATRMTGLGANINETWYAMSNAFFSSAEYIAFNRTDAEFVVDLYKTYFNRLPDTSGGSFWASQLSLGVPRDIVMVSFMLSPEFTAFTRSIFGNTAARAEVDMVMDFYRGVLSRLPDQNGFTFWTQQLRTAQCAATPALAVSQVNAQADTISSQFLTSLEYLGRNRSNGQYVGDLYNAFLRRGGDPNGVQFWISQLSSTTREDLRRRFLMSGEFQRRVSAVIQQGCLP